MPSQPVPAGIRLQRTLLALILFGIAFGYVEAAVVVYLRTIFAPIRHETFHNAAHNDLFPLLTAEHLRAAGRESPACWEWNWAARWPRSQCWRPRGWPSPATFASGWLVS